MDKTVNVRLFRVERNQEESIAFSDALQHIHRKHLANREYEVEPDVIIRLERLSVHDDLISGEMVRLQSGNLPPKALRGHRLERLGVGSIGHTTVFAYNTQFSILALQLARNGLSSSRIGMYAEALAGGDGFSILPLPNREILSKLRTGKVRAARIRVSSPDELQAADADARSIRDGLRALKNALPTTHVEIIMSMGHSDENINRDRVLGLFRWLRTEREEGRGEVSKLSANVIPLDSDHAEVLNLIEGQLGEKQKLELPDDDPERSYQMRKAYVEQVIRGCYPELRQRYA